MFSLAAAPAWCQSAKQKTPPAQNQDFEEPPEEDPDLIPKEYSFNPLEAAKNITAGNFYFKKGNHRAASRRYLEATKWDPTNTEAWYKLGDASERMSDYPQARAAFTKYLELAPDAKNAGNVRKKLAKMPSAKHKS
jgi:tetratricopeptide (TPR) repeat protein